jgi:hypothetical protein
MTMFRLMMRPSNAVCDRLGLTNEHERGMMRMLVNMMICTAIAVVAVYVGWQLFA